MNDCPDQNILEPANAIIGKLSSTLIVLCLLWPGTSLAQECPTHDKNGKECVQITGGTEDDSYGWTLPTIYVANGCGCRCSVNGITVPQGRGTGVIVGPYSNDKFFCINTRKNPQTDCTGFRREFSFSCHPDGDASQRRSDTSQPRVSPKAAAQEAQKKADEARLKAQEAINKAMEKREKEEAERKKLKEAAATTVPSWCRGMVSACEQRAASLANSTQATQNQCKTYCQILNIENCNGGSPTVQHAAQACTADAERDQKEAADRAREAARRRAEQERINAEARRIPVGWMRCSCPGAHGGLGKWVDCVLYHRPGLDCP